MGDSHGDVSVLQSLSEEISCPYSSAYFDRSLLKVITKTIVWTTDIFCQSIPFMLWLMFYSVAGQCSKLFETNIDIENTFANQN